jgi:hypothetical protein
MITDHLSVLQYVLRTKEARHEKLRAVFLLLDIDTFGARPGTNESLQFLSPPALTGESPARFRWKYLTAIQFSAWRFEIARAASRWRSAGPVAAPIQPPVEPSAAPVTADNAQAVARPLPTPAVGGEGFTATDVEFARQLDLLRRFAMLCHGHDVRLIVATTPLHRGLAMLYGAEELERRRERIAAVVPFWDFDSPDWLSNRPDLWGDVSHFVPAVGTMMLDVIFGAEPSSAPPDFGRLYGK